MKICTTCGTEYSEDVDVCDRDGTLLFAHASASQDGVEDEGPTFTLPPLETSMAGPSLTSMDALSESVQGIVSMEEVLVRDPDSSTDEQDDQTLVMDANIQDEILGYYQESEGFVPGVFGAGPESDDDVSLHDSNSNAIPTPLQTEPSASPSASHADGPVLLAADGDSMQPVDLSTLIDEELDGPKTTPDGEPDPSTFFPQEASQMPGKGGPETSSKLPILIVLATVVVLAVLGIGAYFLLPMFGVEI